MKNIMIMSVIGLMLSGCMTTNPPTVPIEVQKYTIPQVPSSLLSCPRVKLPDRFKTNKEVASLLVKEYKTNQVCANHMQGIKDFLNDTEQDLSK